MILSELWKVLCVIGMIAGIGFCAICILMCVLIGVMVIGACVSDEDDDIQDTQSRSVSVTKNSDGAQLDSKNELTQLEEEENDVEEEKVWLVRGKDGWVKTAGKPIYMKVDEDEEESM